MKLRTQKLQTKTKYVCLAIMAVLGVFALAQAYSMEAVASLTPDNILPLDGQWEQVTDDGCTQYRFRVPDNAGSNLLLCLKTYLEDFQVFLDDASIYAFTDIYGTQGRSLHMIQLPLDSPGKLLTVQARQHDTRAAGIRQIGSAYLGAEHDVTMKLLHDNLYALFFVIFALLLGLGTIAAGRWMRNSISKKMQHCLICFGAFVLITGTWVLTDSELLLFFTGRVAVVSLISFVSFMIMPVFLLKFIDDILGQHQTTHILCWLFPLIAALYLANYLFRILPSYLLLVPTHLLCVYSVGVVLRLGWQALKRGKNQTVLWIMQGFGLLSICVLCALVMFYIDPTSQYSVLYCLGILLFILWLMRAMLNVLYGAVEERANMTAYKRLAYTDAMTGMGNRAAFIEAQRQVAASDDLACIMFDINNLKQINDKYGHQKGDHAIITAARAIQDTFDGPGQCFRIGGDEFVVFLKSCPMEQLSAKLDRMRAIIAADKSADTFFIDVAAGYAARRKDELVSSMVERADAEMYVDKESMKKRRTSDTEAQL